MSSYVVEGKAMWSHLVTPFDIFGNDSYQLYLNADDKTLLRFAGKGVEVKSVKYTNDFEVFTVKVHHEVVNEWCVVINTVMLGCLCCCITIGCEVHIPATILATPIRF